MKNLLMILTLAPILCIMVGCQDKAAMAELEEFKDHKEIEEQNKAEVIRFFEEIDKKNFDAYDELLAEDFVIHFPPLPDTNSLEALKQSAQESSVAMPDYSHTIEDIIVKGDKVVVRSTNRGTEKESGKKIEFPAILIFQFTDGEVVEMWAMADHLGFWQQLGMELKPKEEGK